MKKFRIIYLAAILAFTSAGCEDVLDTTASDAFAEDLIYSDPAQVERLVFTAYNSTESWGFNKSQWWSRRFNIEAASYEARFNFNDIDQFRLRAGLTPSNMGVFLEKWKTYWEYVRSINEFLDRIDNSKAMQSDPDKVKVLKAEMKFLRANLYSKLISFYGGVPIMEHALGLNDDFNLKRNSYQECVEFIVKELDEAAAVLPPTRPDDEYGRATKLAALAVKSRTLLYAASKLHDPASAPLNNPLYTYNKATKWQDAANAAKAVIDLVGSRDLTPVANAKEYQELFLKPNADNLFVRPYGPTYYDFGTDVNSLWDQTQSPSGYGGWGLSTPTHNFALEFDMADGSSTSGPGSTYNPAAPNANREMRYYANLNFQGAMFRGRAVDYALFVPATSGNSSLNGPDSPKGLVDGIGVNQAHSSKTGYNIRKFQNESVALTAVSPQRPFILYRLAEIYLNYAEALYHVGGQETVAKQYLNKVVKRALQPEITSSGPALLEDIKNERRKELAFEGHNFFDERRWMNEAHLGYETKGLKWTKTAAGVATFTEYTIETMPWNKRHYYLPIPATEIEKAPNLVQNEGY